MRKSGEQSYRNACQEAKKKQQQQNTSCRNMENMKPRPKTVTKTAPFSQSKLKTEKRKSGRNLHAYLQTFAGKVIMMAVQF